MPGQGGGQLIRLKFGAEVRNCIWHLYVGQVSK